MLYALLPNGVKRTTDGAEIPAVPGNSDFAEYKAWLAKGNTPDPVPPPDLQSTVVGLVQARLDDFARTRGYDGVLSACTYATSATVKFKAEGAYCVNARDAHWSACYQILADVQAGKRAVPTVAQVLAELPALVWPV